jgi:hypothetical protein
MQLILRVAVLVVTIGVITAFILSNNRVAYEYYTKKELPFNSNGSCMLDSITFIENSIKNVIEKKIRLINNYKFYNLEGKEFLNHAVAISDDGYYIDKVADLNDDIKGKCDFNNLKVDEFKCYLKKDDSNEFRELKKEEFTVRLLYSIEFDKDFNYTVLIDNNENNDEHTFYDYLKTYKACKNKEFNCFNFL